jgi:hypothetical protein
LLQSLIPLYEELKLNKVEVQLKDYAGRDFGGEFEAISVSVKDGKIYIELLYCGKKASKRLSVAALSIDEGVLNQLRKQG